MTPDGRFRTPPASSGLPLTTKVGAAAVLVAVVTGALGIAALLLWAAVLLIPVALAAGVLAWLAFRFQLWRARGGVVVRGNWPPRRT